MAEAQFNPPPNWPIEPGFTPSPDWAPDPTWPPAPAGWQFWVDKPPPIEEDDEQPWAAAPEEPAAEEPAPWTAVAPWTTPEPAKPVGQRPQHLKSGLIVGAIVLAVALVAGTLAAITWWPKSPDAAAHRPDGMLAGTYPTQPEPAWTVQAKSLTSESDPRIATPLFGGAYYASPGAIVIGDHVLVHTGPGQSSDRGAQLVSLNLADGRVEWSVPVDLSDGCARNLLGDTLPCVKSGGQHQAYFIDINSGATVSTVTVPYFLSMIASDGEHLYTAGYDNPAGLTVAKGSRENPTADWKSVISGEACDTHGGGDGMDLHVKDGLVWGFLGGGNEIALHDSNGTPVFDHGVADVAVMDGPTVTALDCEAGGDPSNWKTDVADGQGKQLFTSSAAITHPSLSVYSGGQAPLVTTTGSGLDPSTGKTLWQTTPSGGSNLGYRTAVVGNVLLADDDGPDAYDMRTGENLWHSSSDADLYQDVVTDGPHLFTVNHSGGIDAISITDGSVAWSREGGSQEDTSGQRLYATERGLLVVRRNDITLLPPTGPAVPVPSVTGATADEQKDGGTRLVTKCGRPPEFEPETIRADSGALVITMKIVAHCPGGDVLSAAQTRLSVTSNGQNVASAIFDLSKKPIVIEPNSGGSQDNPSVTHEFRFPVGTFWRIPVSTQQAPTNGSTSQGDVDLTARTLLIACDQSGASASEAQPDASASQSSTATSPGRPASGDDESASFDALRALANADRPFVSSQLADRWVAQLSAKQPGLVADGITWHNAETLREHLDLRLKYPEVRLLWTGDWSTFSSPDFWVTIAGVTFPDAREALAWCSSHGFDRDHCYAKLVSSSHPVDGSTAFN